MFYFIINKIKIKIKNLPKLRVSAYMVKLKIILKLFTKIFFKIFFLCL